MDGTPIDGPSTLRKALLDRSDAFVGTLTDKLLMYGVGRETKYYDMPTVRAIMRDAARADYGKEATDSPIWCWRAPSPKWSSAVHRRVERGELRVQRGRSRVPAAVHPPTSKTVQTAGTPFTHKFGALNSPLGYGGAYGAQPPTHTFTDVTNIVNVFTSATYGTAPSNTFGARMYPSAALKSLDFSGNAEQLLRIKMAGDSWQSVPAGTAVTNVTTK